MIEPTEDEKKFCKALRRLLKKAPSTLWFFVADDSQLHAMRKDKDGKRIEAHDGYIDQDFIVDSFGEVEFDGGQW